MTKITWAAVSAIAALAAACTTEIVSGSNDGGTATSAGSGGGSGGAAGSSTSTGSSGAGTTGGAGGSSGTDAGACFQSPTASACETCAFQSCQTEVCACKGNVDCNGEVNAYLTCLAGLDGGDMESCASNFTVNAGPTGTGLANELATCMDVCIERCQGKDAGPRR
jgi:hypothetical protein